MPEFFPNKKFEGSWLVILVLILLFIVLKQSFYLRSVGYDHVPDTYVVLDERTNVWHGLSIRSSGVPAAWSNLGIYKTGTGGDVKGLNLSVADGKMPNLANFKDFPKPVYVLYPINLGVERGIKHIGFVQPYLDHPPFGALVLSQFTSNVKTFTDLTAHEFRKGSLWMGLASGVLIFVLGWQISANPFIGLLASAIYGSVPTFNLLSRYALLENVMNPLILLSIILLVFAQKNLKYQKWLLLTAGIFSGLAALTKLTGWSTLLIGVALLRYWNFKIKTLLLFVVPATVLGLLYFIWGLYLDPTLFINIFRYQGLERGFIGSINFIISSGQIGILNFPLDGWWIGGFLSFLLISFKKEYSPIFFAAAIILLTALFLGGANYPWYFIPLIPLMCICIAMFIWQTAKSPTILSILIFFLFFFSSSFYWGYGVYQASLESTNYQQPFSLYRLLFILIIFGSLLLNYKFKKVRHLHFVFILIITLAMLRLNERSIYFMLSHWGKFPSLYTPGTF